MPHSGYTPWSFYPKYSKRMRHTHKSPMTWWRHQMETFSASLVICEGNPPVTGGIPSRGADVFFDVCPDKRLSKQTRCWWFETTKCSLWRHCNGERDARCIEIRNLVYFCHDRDHSGFHDDVIKWKPFPRNWPFVHGIHRSPVNSPHKGQRRRSLMFSLIYARINGWVNTGDAGDLRRHHPHYDVIVMSALCIGRISGKINSFAPGGFQ